MCFEIRNYKYMLSLNKFNDKKLILIFFVTTDMTVRVYRIKYFFFVVSTYSYLICVKYFCITQNVKKSILFYEMDIFLWNNQFLNATSGCDLYIYLKLIDFLLNYIISNYSKIKIVPLRYLIQIFFFFINYLSIL